VIQGVNGFLVPARNVRELVQAMRTFLDRPAMIEAMGRQSRRIAESRYDLHAVNRKILDVMEL
jgi:glycosyltransferase involved in cell wall biosynthesis